MSPCCRGPARPVLRRRPRPNPSENAAAAPGVVPRQLEFRQNANTINPLRNSGVQVGPRWHFRDRCLLLGPATIPEQVAGGRRIRRWVGAIWAYKVGCRSRSANHRRDSVAGAAWQRIQFRRTPQPTRPASRHRSNRADPCKTVGNQRGGA